MARSGSVTRSRLVRTTRQLIEDRGIARVTTKQIARAAGGAEETIFRHFPRKEDLLLAAVFVDVPAFQESLAIVSGETPRGRLRRLCLNVIRFFEQITPAAVAVLSDAELTRRHREVVRGRNGGSQRLYAAVAEFIETEQARGGLRSDLSPAQVASALVGPCFFWVFTRLSLGKNALRMTDRQFVAGVLDVLWDGLHP
ncbi:MAG TPA: TetR/AcrR family transcriptional regulator [bacterium]|nr:TetR/AcrR family transcriptional regulator [bacterium]